MFVKVSAVLSAYSLLDGGNWQRQGTVFVLC